MKFVNITGICTNCNKEKTCDFIKDIDVFIKDKKYDEKTLDSEVSIYSCNDYEAEKDICIEGEMCLNCKPEV